ncbi:MAG: hypothetical protein LBN32_04540, partial [Helicobacteraceae bacterium]|nr:hypothetical protein [Helicobacteraceae bacterium]
MPKAALLLLGIAAALFAEEQIEMFAQSVTHEGNITRAQGDVAIRSEGRFMRADNLIFCRDTGEGEMFGNVYYSRSNEDLIVSDYIWFKNGISRQLLVDHLFSAFAKSGLWLSGNEAEIDGNVSIIRQGALSGCDPSDPDWSIRFSSATYDRTDEWIDLYNSVFYAGGVPLIYLPYFGYYTDGKRHSGFLFPRWGNSNTDGTMFELPLYFAPFDFADLEIWKQWRGIRGEGEAMTLRFVDSAHSKGRINIGRFIDNISYAAAKGVQERVKYGGDILYERTRVFTDANSPDQEGLTLDYRDFNDIEYIQLRSIDPIRKENYIDYLVTNKADFFYKNDDIYANTNVRYFKDYKTRSNNDRIVQILPEAQLHLFNRSLFSKHVLFNADIRYRNLSRKIGSVAQDISVTTPIEWYFSAFDDFLKLSAQYQIDYYQIIYNNRGDKQLSNGTRSSSTLTLKAGTSVAKDYGNFFHTIDSGLTFIDTPAQNTRGDFTEDFYTPVVEIEQEVSTDYY